jgi:hypothetical protein
VGHTSGISVAVARGARIALILGVVGTVVMAGPVAAAAPDNDTIAGARIISPNTLSGASNAISTGATKVNEPTPSCQTNVGATIWYRYRPPTGMRIGLNTNGSAFDTVLAVYKSGSAGLVQVACDDDNGTGTASVLEFVGAGNTTYYIQIGGYQGASGSIQFAYSFVVANDNFANAKTISPGFSDDFNNASATTQGNEPQSHSCSDMGRTVWYRYKPTQNRTVTFDTLGSDLDSLVAVYRGTSISGLTHLACSDDFDESPGDASVTFAAVKGKTYYIQVGGYQNQYGLLNVNFYRNP